MQHHFVLIKIDGLYYFKIILFNFKIITFKANILPNGGSTFKKSLFCDVLVYYYTALL